MIATKSVNVRLPQRTETNLGDSFEQRLLRLMLKVIKLYILVSKCICIEIDF